MTHTHPMAAIMVAATLALAPPPAQAEADGRLMAASEMVEMRLAQWGGGLVSFTGGVGLRFDHATGNLVGAFPAGQAIIPIKNTQATMQWQAVPDAVILHKHDAAGRKLTASMADFPITLHLGATRIATGKMDISYTARLVGDDYVAQAASSRFANVTITPINGAPITLLEHMEMAHEPLQKGSGEVVTLALDKLNLPMAQGSIRIDHLTSRQEYDGPADFLHVARMADKQHERWQLARAHKGEDWAIKRDAQLAAELAAELPRLMPVIKPASVTSRLRLEGLLLEIKRPAGNVQISIPQMVVLAPMRVPEDAEAPIEQLGTASWQGLAVTGASQLPAPFIPRNGRITQHLRNVTPSMLEPWMADYVRAGWLADPAKPATGIYAPLALTALALLPHQFVAAKAAIEHDIWLENGPLVTHGKLQILPSTDPTQMLNGLPLRLAVDLELAGIADALADWPASSADGQALRAMLNHASATRLSADRVRVSIGAE